MCFTATIGWDGMGWDGMGWDGMALVCRYTLGALMLGFSLLETGTPKRLVAMISAELSNQSRQALENLGCPPPRRPPNHSPRASSLFMGLTRVQLLLQSHQRFSGGTFHFTIA